MPMSLSFTDRDEPCEDKAINNKCMLLDIEIWKNTEDCADIKAGQWYIVRCCTDNVLVWSHKDDDTTTGAYDSAQAALDAYIRDDEGLELL